MKTDDEMRALGFTDRNPDSWYWCKQLASDITLNITVRKSDGGWTELVMDEMFGQPYHYGYYDTPLAKSLPALVDAEIARLNAAGIPVAVDHREYGVDQ